MVQAANHYFMGVIGLRRGLTKCYGELKKVIVICPKASRLKKWA
ncbi:hypothetical protein ABH904_000735 [Pseudomonas frederiksbergensis]|jgi:hypothetical protein